MAQKPEIKIEKVVLFDSKLEGLVKTVVKKAGEGAVGGALDEAYVIRLVPTVKFDEKAGELTASCTWTIYAGGGKNLFARLKQTRGSTARATASKDKVTQGNLEDTIGAVVENEVKGIAKGLKSFQ